MSRSRWQRSPSLMTCSPTSCAVSTGSDRRHSQHDERAVPHACRSRERCVRNKAWAAISNANTSHWLSIAGCRYEPGRKTQGDCVLRDIESRSIGLEGSKWEIPAKSIYSSNRSTARFTRPVTSRGKGDSFILDQQEFPVAARSCFNNNFARNLDS